MKIKTYLLALILAICGAGTLSASSLPDMGALERAVVKSAREAEYKGFNPHLSQEQMQEIPQLVAKGKEYLSGSHQANVFVAGIYYHLYNQVSEEMKEQLSREDKDLYLEHALDYVFSVLFKNDEGLEFIFGEQPYNSANYPAVQNYKRFNDVCQMYMDMTYKTLQEVSLAIDNGDGETFQEIMLDIW